MVRFHRFTFRQFASLLVLPCAALLLLAGGMGWYANYAAETETREAVENIEKIEKAERLEKAAEAALFSAEAIEARLQGAVDYLASPELEGRGVGTEGIDKAAEYLAEEFRAIGLKTDVVNGGPFQELDITVAPKPLGPEHNRLAIRFLTAENAESAEEKERADSADGSDPSIALEFDKQFRPLATGGSAKFDLPVVFAGYGIAAKDAEFDEYAHIDVKGKAVIILRKEPQQGMEEGKFGRAHPTQHALFATKIAAAKERGAAAIIFVNDGYSVNQKQAELQKAWQTTAKQFAETQAELAKIEQPTPEQLRAYRKDLRRLAERLAEQTKQFDDADGADDAADELLAFSGAGDANRAGDGVPVVFLKRAAIDAMLEKSASTTLAALEKEIDARLAPQSRELPGVRLQGEIGIERRKAPSRNVIAVLPGEGELARETIVIGAHYDHLGMGGAGSLAPWTVAIHPGADDNASGTAALVEVARQLAARESKPRRTIVFIAFTGEEMGLLGSAHYVRHPVFPLDGTVAMLNMDMVGRLRDNKLLVHGTGTAEEFGAILDNLEAKHAFKIARTPGGMGPSDHATFAAREIPVLHFFTDLHNDYHRPSDTADTLNVEGIRRVAAIVADTAAAIDAADERFAFKEVRRRGPRRPVEGARPYFGSIPDFAQEGDNFRLSGVSKGGPAEKAGLKAGDIIRRLGDAPIASLEDFDSALRTFKAGDEVPVVVERDGETLTFKVVVEAAR